MIIGGTGHGKSSFFNSLDNYFNNLSMEELEVVIPTPGRSAKRGAPVHTERASSDISQSQTSLCTDYVYQSP